MISYRTSWFFTNNHNFLVRNDDFEWKTWSNQSRAHGRRVVSRGCLSSCQRGRTTLPGSKGTSHAHPLGTLSKHLLVFLSVWTRSGGASNVRIWLLWSNDPRRQRQRFFLKLGMEPTWWHDRSNFVIASSRVKVSSNFKSISCTGIESQQPGENWFNTIRIPSDDRNFRYGIVKFVP